MNNNERELDLVLAFKMWLKAWKMTLVLILVCVSVMCIFQYFKNVKAEKAEEERIAAEVEMAIKEEKIASDEDDLLVKVADINELNASDKDEIHAALCIRNILSRYETESGYSTVDPEMMYYIYTLQVKYQDICNQFDDRQIHVWNKLSDDKIDIEEAVSIESEEELAEKPKPSMLDMVKPYIKKAIFGVVAGMIASAGIIILKLLFSGKMVSGNDMVSMYGINGISADEVEDTLIAMQKKGFFNKLLIISLVEGNELNIPATLSEKISIKISTSNDYIAELAEYDGVLLIVREEDTHYTDIDKVVDKCKLLESRIIGYCLG